MALLGGAALRLFRAVARFAAGAAAEAERRRPAAHVAALPAEWADVFAPDLTADLLALTVHVLGKSTRPLLDHPRRPRSPTRSAAESAGERDASAAHVAMVDELQRALRLLNWERLPAAQRQGPFALSRLCGAGAAALAGAGHAAYKCLAFDLLAALAQPLVREDGEWRRPRAPPRRRRLTPAPCSRETGGMERDAGGGGRAARPASLRADLLRARVERRARAAGRRDQPVHVSPRSLALRRRASPARAGNSWTDEAFKEYRPYFSHYDE